MMATRTTTTRTTRTGSARSADSHHLHAAPSFADLVEAYHDCRRTKRQSRSALAFELDLERNLVALYEELIEGRYRPGRSICFVITHPKPREVWAADFRDRIVHHLLYAHIGPRFECSFIADSCACIKGRGTLYAAERLEAKVRSVSRNWSRRAYYLKCDLANFFVSIDKRVLAELLVARIPEPFWRALTLQVLWHDPRQDYEWRGDRSRRHLVPAHKQLVNQPPERGLPIGNLSSQFFGNVYLNALDQFVKHELRARHYVRYVDDFVLLHESAQWLNAAHDAIAAFLPDRMHVELNPRKTILQPVARGVDFVGQVIRPWHRTTRRKTVAYAEQRIATVPDAKLLETANSYFGLVRQASHSFHDRRRIARAVLRRGRSVNGALTKTFREN